MPPWMPPTYLNLDGHHLQSFDQHLVGLMPHDECAGAGHLVVDVAVVVVNVDTKVVHRGRDLLH